MANILFTSNGFFTTEIKERFLHLLSKRPEVSSVGIITTASPQKQHNRFAIKALNDFFEMKFHDVRFIDIELDPLHLLANLDVIYINGGNPFYLLHQLRKGGAGDMLKAMSHEPKVFVGVSAGSVVLGPSIEIVNYFTPELNTISLDDLNGLNITKKVIFPHYDREDLFHDITNRSIEQRITQFEKRTGYFVHRLTDDGFIIEQKRDADQD